MPGQTTEQPLYDVKSAKKILASIAESWSPSAFAVSRAAAAQRLLADLKLVGDKQCGIGAVVMGGDSISLMIGNNEVIVLHCGKGRIVVFQEHRENERRDVELTFDIVENRLLGPARIVTAASGEHVTLYKDALTTVVEAAAAFLSPPA